MRRPIFKYDDNDSVGKVLAKSFAEATVESTAVWTGFFCAIVIVGTVLEKTKKNHPKATPAPEED